MRKLKKVVSFLFPNIKIDSRNLKEIRMISRKMDCVIIQDWDLIIFATKEKVLAEKHWGDNH